MKSLPPRVLFGAALVSLVCGSSEEPGAKTAAPEPEPTTYAQTMLGALDRGTIERTRSDMRAIGTALAAFAMNDGDYPNVGDYDALAALVAPTHIRRLPRQDAWGSDFHYEKTAQGYRLTAPGADGAVGTGDDIVLDDGSFTKLPEGYRDPF